MNRRILILTALAVALIALLYYVYGAGGAQAPSGQPPLTSLNADNFSTLKNQFNASRDSTRVILLLSPT